MLKDLWDMGRKQNQYLKSIKQFYIVKTDQLDNLEDTLRTLGKRANLSLNKKQSIRDKVFQSIGQIELAEAIVSGEQKATVVSLQYLKKALIPQKLSFSMPTTIAVVTFVFIASVMTGAIAQSANPTDKLFGVKKVLERIELAFTQSPVSKAKITLNIADERLKYLESSLTEEKKLEQVLKESQIALVSAKAALQKAQESEEDTQDISDLVERFSLLLDDQKTLLNNIDEDATEDVKNAVLAIREALVEDDVVTDSELEDNNIPVVAIVPKTPVPVIDKIVVLPTEGRHMLRGRIGTAYGKPVIYIGDKYYQITSSPINLLQYVGYEDVQLTGDISENNIKVYRVVINSIVLVDNLSPK